MNRRLGTTLLASALLTFGMTSAQAAPGADEVKDEPRSEARALARASSIEASEEAIARLRAANRETLTLPPREQRATVSGD